jgi:hypothetical protein
MKETNTDKRGLFDHMLREVPFLWFCLPVHLCLQLAKHVEK